MAEPIKIKISPQPGPQWAFHASPADIAIMGGAAGGGKTWSLLYEPLRHINNPLFAGTTFRRESTQIRIPGGLWDESRNLYSPLGLKPSETYLEWKRGERGWKHKFSSLQYETDMYDWQGGQVAYLGWDEIVHFEESQFWYLLSRLRSMSGVKGYARATCNPDPDSWVCHLISWWINQDTGFPILERSGVLRWFIRVKNEMVWADSKAELMDRYPEDGKFAKSLTFIPANIFDNKVLLDKDPAYLGNLRALPLVDRERLLGGNWKIRAQAGTVFKREWFEIVEAAPSSIRHIRYWDRASTEPSPENKDPDWTAGVRMCMTANGQYFIEDLVHERQTPMGVERTIKNTASQDGVRVEVGIEQDPGQAGVMEADYYIRALAGYNVKKYLATKDKLTRAKPLSAQAEAGNIKLVRAQWNKALLDEFENFPGKGHDDIVDAASGAFSALNSQKQLTPRITFL